MANTHGSLPVLDNLNHILHAQKTWQQGPHAIFDASENFGDKPIGGNGLVRLMQFCKWSFDRKESTVIVGGHSLYFKNFFRTFLPRELDHIAKNVKVQNTGVVGFNLERSLAKDTNGEAYVLSSLYLPTLCIYLFISLSTHLGFS